MPPLHYTTLAPTLHSLLCRRRFSFRFVSLKVRIETTIFYCIASYSAAPLVRLRCVGEGGAEGDERVPPGQGSAVQMQGTQ